MEIFGQWSRRRTNKDRRKIFGEGKEGKYLSGGEREERVKRRKI